MGKFRFDPTVCLFIVLQYLRNTSLILILVIILHDTVTVGSASVAVPFATGGLFGLPEIEFVEVVETVVDGAEEGVLGCGCVCPAMLRHIFYYIIFIAIQLH